MINHIARHKHVKMRRLTGRCGARMPENVAVDAHDEVADSASGFEF